MSEILILQHAEFEGPGFFGELLREHELPFRVLRLDRGEALPGTLEGIRALVMMGGPMSVNDEDQYPWLGPEMALIRQAVTTGLPTLGHCLGGQLIARALGGTISRNPVKEIGWHAVEKTPAGMDSPYLHALLQRFELFHWHGETFSLPEGAVHLLGNENCTNQAFSIGGHVLGFQCHPEVTARMVRDWCCDMAEDLESLSPAVQTPQTMQQDLESRIQGLHETARAIYAPWLARVHAGTT
ncbi:type 1 glutamine amidotransferase [Thermithiobacillus plumbiphilus]|uniref:Type 1 glutamine amidotransferase n=1 Tax=Thermithiobacillus plumbiphilus TaxID=1729899 RepID=A0ABU9D7I7_9PROT